MTTAQWRRTAGIGLGCAAGSTLLAYGGGAWIAEHSGAQDASAVRVGIAGAIVYVVLMARKGRGGTAALAGTLASLGASTAHWVV